MNVFDTWLHVLGLSGTRSGAPVVLSRSPLLRCKAGMHLLVRTSLGWQLHRVGP